MLFFGLFLVQPLLIIVPHSAHDHHADHLRAVHGRLVRDREPPVRRLADARRSALPAFFLRRHDYPMPPFVLGLVLGDILDKSLRRGLTLSDGSLLPFFTRPICALLFADHGVHDADVLAAFNRAVTHGARAIAGALREVAR